MAQAGRDYHVEHRQQQILGAAAPFCNYPGVGSIMRSREQQGDEIMVESVYKIIEQTGRENQARSHGEKGRRGRRRFWRRAAKSLRDLRIVEGRAGWTWQVPERAR